MACKITYVLLLCIEACVPEGLFFRPRQGTKQSRAFSVLTGSESECSFAAVLGM